MCGIAAILHDPALPADPAAVGRMTAALVHRGPDDQRVARLPGGCDLGHTRLSILDHAGGAQPMAHPSGRWTIVFNGEIYNHADLRRELAGRGVAFRTRSDTEVLLHAFAELGPACLNRLNGQFAFAVWDRDRKELFAARDRFGEKPLYWARSPHGHLLVGSEIKAIEASGLVSPRIDPLSVELYLGLYYVPPDRTIYRNVHALPPGHAIVWRRGESAACDDVRAFRWWSPRLSHLRVDRGEAVGEIRRLLGRAVDRQMLADVPVGAFLSGGLDSSTLVGLMAERHGSDTGGGGGVKAGASHPVRTFAAGFGELIDELPYARAVADRYATDHHESHVERIDVAAELSAMARAYDEPFGDSSNIPTSLIARQARAHVKVVLSGDGGDELFGGYAWYEPALAALGTTAGHPAPRTRSTNAHGAAVGPPAAQTRTARTHPAGDAWSDHVARTGPISADRSALWSRRGQPPGLDALAQRYRPGGEVGGLDAATHFDVGCYLAGDILVKVDRAAMACGLETRAPFLDAELAEFVLGLPSEMRFAPARPAAAMVGASGHTSGSASASPSNPSPRLKGLLRDAFGQLWPDAVRTRNKQGFGAPVNHWLQRPEVRQVWDRVTSRSGPLAHLLPGSADPAVTADLRPQRRWALLCLGVWLQGRESCLAGLS